MISRSEISFGAQITVSECSTAAHTCVVSWFDGNHYAISHSLHNMKKNCWYVSYNKDSSQNDLNLNVQKTLKQRINQTNANVLNQDGISAFVSIWSHAPIILNNLGVFQIYAAKLATIRHILSGIIPKNPHEYPMIILQKSRKTHNM